MNILSKHILCIKDFLNLKFKYRRSILCVQVAFVQREGYVPDKIQLSEISRKTWDLKKYRKISNLY